MLETYVGFLYFDTLFFLSVAKFKQQMGTPCKEVSCPNLLFSLIFCQFKICAFLINPILQSGFKITFFNGHIAIDRRKLAQICESVSIYILPKSWGNFLYTSQSLAHQHIKPLQPPFGKVMEVTVLVFPERQEHPGKLKLISLPSVLIILLSVPRL